MSKPIIAPPAPSPWQRLSRPGEKCSSRWRHESGWILAHCGHPTANWPYFLIDPHRPELVIVSHNGLGFKSLDVAQAVIEELAAGRIDAITEDCVPGIGRVLCTAFGKRVAA